jgi:hypothetical protein
MARLSYTIRQLWESAGMLYTCMSDAVWFLQLCRHSTAALAAENLFLRKQLARYQGRHVIPRCPTYATRFTLVWLSQGFDWRPALAVGQPETFPRWRRQRCKPCWCCTSGPGRPPMPGARQALIRQMARDHLTWGQRRIANQRPLKRRLGSRRVPGTRISPGICTLVQAAARRPSAGVRSFAITRGTSSPVAWPPISPEGCRPVLHG